MYAVARSACYSKVSRVAGLGFGRGIGLGLGRNVSAPLRRDFRDGINSGVADFRRRSFARVDLGSIGLRRQSTLAETSSQSQSQSSQASPRTTTPPEKPKKPLYIRLPLAALLTLLTFSLGFAMAAAPALPTASTLIHPPTDEETLTLFTPTSSSVAEIEAQIFAHPLTKSLLQDEKYIASRPHLKIPEQMRAQNLTGGTLLGPDKIAVPPLQFATLDGTSFVSLQYIGPALCGHPGIIHGGLLATLLDEGLARCCFPALPNKVAVTASLKIDYKKPAMAGQVLVLKAETTRVEGRKAWVKGRLETLVDEEKGEKPVVLTEGEALFIEPRQAASMKRVVS